VQQLRRTLPQVGFRFPSVVHLDETYQPTKPLDQSVNILRVAHGQHPSTTPARACWEDRKGRHSPDRPPTPRSKLQLILPKEPSGPNNYCVTTPFTEVHMEQVHPAAIPWF
jgi:hypothetical protein